MSPRVWVRSSPTTAPRARGSWTGVRSPEKCGSTSSPRAPGGEAAASAASVAKAVSGARSRANWSRNQWVSVPDVASPAMLACSPGNSQGAYHRRASRRGAAVTWIRNTVEPYIIIVSPGAVTPALTASAAASMVPQVTGVPGRRPVSAAAAAVTWPAMSVDHISRGSRSGPTVSSMSVTQSIRPTS